MSGNSANGWGGRLAGELWPGPMCGRATAVNVPRSSVPVRGQMGIPPTKVLCLCWGLVIFWHHLTPYFRFLILGSSGVFQ